ncbi:Uma2 family endonuclease [Aureimonas psammosilenae]|uniref:Uma2 family endonuclease n=1 Tax=Aureimonas psammosilenae TaxID=2495496 RepID=UPI0012612AE0|nr:Uma2 family endonuclease [Aureimonas psammosilenae]
MAFPEYEAVSTDDFLRWIGTQSDRFELVDGRIIRMMAGAKQSHNVVTANLVATLLPQARKGGCRTTSSDTAVRIGQNTVRYPDVVVDCGPSDPNALDASRPTTVVEVSSPGTSAIDATDKLDEYQAHGGISLIMFVDPDVISAKLYRRDERGMWQVEKYDDLDEIIELPEIGATLPLSEIYASLYPAPRPRLRLVEDGKPA